MQKYERVQTKDDIPSTSVIENVTVIEEKAIVEGMTCGECILIKQLKEGDETAFTRLVEHYHNTLLLLARRYVRSQSSAEEVVQETWMGVLQGLPTFERRSSLKTWIFRILTNNAHTRALRDQRVIPFSSLAEREEESETFAGEPECFDEVRRPFAGNWTSLIEDKHEQPEENLLSSEAHAHIAGIIEALPANQRTVMVLCDIEGLRSEEICTRLGISMVNQRVLLHRARSKVRRVLQSYFDEG